MYLNSKPGAASGSASEQTLTSGLFSLPSSYSSYSSPYSTYSSYNPYSSTLSTSYSTLTSSMGTKLPGLETFHAPSSSSSTSTSFSSMYSNGSGLTLGSHSTEFERMTSLLKSTNEKPSLMSHDTPTSHMTASDSLLSGLKSQPQTGSQPPAISKVRPITRAAQYTSIFPLGKLVHVMVQCVAVPARNQTYIVCITAFKAL